MNTTYLQSPASDGLVRLHGDTPITTSPIVAEIFGKRHDHVLRDIRDLLEELELVSEGDVPNFGEISYQDNYGRHHPCYEMTHDGFALLAMGFTGREALRFKLRFIEAFNALERRVQALHQRETARLRQALLEREPRWGAIARYQQMGLMQIEMARLLGVSGTTIRREQREMEGLGLLPTQGDTPQLSLLAGGAA